MVLLFTLQARAIVTTYGSRADFTAQGTIDFNSGFTDFGIYFGFPGDPFTRGDVTYHSSQNLTWGSGTPYTTTEPLIGNNYWTPILGDIATGPKYDMFGFDIGTVGQSKITISVSTSLGTYTYPSLTIADSRDGLLQFKGFIASASEYFTGFNISADSGPGNLPGLTHVTLGHSGATVPDGGHTLVLLGLGSVCLVILRRRKALQA